MFRRAKRTKIEAVAPKEEEDVIQDRNKWKLYVEKGKTYKD